VDSVKLDPLDLLLSLIVHSLQQKNDIIMQFSRVSKSNCT